MNVAHLITDYQLNNTKVTFTLKKFGCGGVEHKTPAPIKIKVKCQTHNFSFDAP